MPTNTAEETHSLTPAVRSHSTAGNVPRPAINAADADSRVAGHKKSRNNRIGNRNAVRHGLRSGSLPKGCAYVKRECDEMRRAIEEAVASLNDGDVSLYQAALIQSTMRWERHALLAQRWLRDAVEQMDHQERLAYSRDIAKASAERDKCLEKLGLGKEVKDLLDVLYVDTEPHAASCPACGGEGEEEYLPGQWRACPECQ
jgi:hypothetical protein